MGKVETENISIRYPCFFYFNFIVEAFDQAYYSFFKGYVDMTLLKRKSLSASCVIIFLFLFSTPTFSQYALYFDGNSRVDLGDAHWFPSGAYTIEASVKPDVISGLSYLFSSAGMWGNNISSLVFDANSISLYTRASFEFGTAYTSSFVLPTNRFTYIAVTFNEFSQVAKIYINGVELPVSSSIVSMLFPYIYSIGNLSMWSASGYGFKGYLDALVISGYERTAAEIANTAKNGLACNPLSVGCWLFEENGGYVALDSSGNARHGLLQGTGGASNYVMASAPGGSASSIPFGSSGSGSGSGSGSASGVSAAFGAVGSSSGLVTGVGAIAVGAGGLLGIFAAFSAVSKALRG